MKITATQVKKYLQTKSKEQLINEISELYDKCLAVRDFYIAKIVVGGNSLLLDKYKKIIKNEFFPERGDEKMRLSIARKAVTEFKKYSSSIEDIAYIMVYYVEIGVKFTLEYEDINEPFYNSMESMYDSALNFIAKSGIKENFRKRCLKIVDDTKGMGWGFHDSLCDMYYECFGAE